MWRQADRYGVPRMCFVNKLDRTGANFFRCVDMIKDRLKARQHFDFAHGLEADFKGIIDLVRMKALIWHDDSLGAKYDILDIPADLLPQAQEYREKLWKIALTVMTSWRRSISMPNSKRRRNNRCY